MKKIFILGASGSIGENALSVIDSNKEKFEITWDDLSSFLTEEVNHNELTGNSTNYKRGIQPVDYVTRVKDYYYLILGLGCN